jgi:hypothetical protein
MLAKFGRFLSPRAIHCILLTVLPALAEAIFNS